MAALNGETLTPVREILVNALRDGKLEPVELGMLNKALQRVHRDLVKAGKISDAKDLENEGPFEIDRLRTTFQQGAERSGGWAVSANALRDNRVAITGEDKRTVAALQYLNTVETKQALARACPGVKLEAFEILKGEAYLRISYQSPPGGFVPAYQVGNALKGLLKKVRLDEGVEMFVFPAPNKGERRW